MSITKEGKYKQILKSTRFYKKKLPDINEFIYTYVKGYQDMGIDCYINEYKAEAFMSFRDASSSKKLRNIRKDVIKSRNYILMVTKVDKHKGFIDVEKRSIDSEDEKKYIDLINFYQKVFIVFIKSFVFNNIDCSQDDVYDFLQKTLWKQDPKNIRENLYLIHNSKDKVKDDYGLNDELGNIILKKLITIIPKPFCRMNIRLQINSLSVDASGDIKRAVEHFENKLDRKFKVTSAPLYECKYDIPINGEDEDTNKAIIEKCQNTISNTETKFTELVNELDFDSFYIKDSGSFHEIIQ
jgi:translation initiation factor 2 alpha subunit (eIF-2alpha)